MRHKENTNRVKLVTAPQGGKLRKGNDGFNLKRYQGQKMLQSVAKKR